uniref:Uncharacterized protein n=1 Tax=Oryza glumipatula TaxID=40148 RepID=A0A0E0BQE0_9ORYZ
MTDTDYNYINITGSSLFIMGKECYGESEETKRRLLYADHEKIFSWLDESKHVQGIGSVSRWFSEQMFCGR